MLIFTCDSLLMGRGYTYEEHRILRKGEASLVDPRHQPPIRMKHA